MYPAIGVRGGGGHLCRYDNHFGPPGQKLVNLLKFTVLNLAAQNPLTILFAPPPHRQQNLNLPLGVREDGGRRTREIAGRRGSESE